MEEDENTDASPNMAAGGNVYKPAFLQDNVYEYATIESST